MRQTILNVLRSFLALILAALVYPRVAAPKLLPVVFFQTPNWRSQLIFQSEFLSRILLISPLGLPKTQKQGLEYAKLLSLLCQDGKIS